jgi:hypothetical protein
VTGPAVEWLESWSPDGPSLRSVRPILRLIDEDSYLAYLCRVKPGVSQAGCPLTDLPPAPVWRPDREPVR